MTNQDQHEPLASGPSEHPDAPEVLVPAETVAPLAHEDGPAAGEGEDHADLALATVPASRLESRQRHRSVGRLIREIFIVVVLALLLSTFIRHFVLQVYSIPSPSMENTLMPGDRILVNRLPVVGKQVERGDVVVFSDTLHWMAPEESAGSSNVLTSIGVFMGLVPADGNRVMVKRVIAVGGDTVGATESGQITINGTVIDEPYLPEGAVPTRLREDVEVPEGYYWVLGDNRNRSGDSAYHYSLGNDPFISDQDVIGKVQWVIFPFNHWSSVSERDAFADVRSAGDGT